MKSILEVEKREAKINARSTLLSAYLTDFRSLVEQPYDGGSWMASIDAAAENPFPEPGV
jgi:hypothetical protein